MQRYGIRGVKAALLGLLAALTLAWSGGTALADSFSYPVIQSGGNCGFNIDCVHIGYSYTVGSNQSMQAVVHDKTTGQNWYYAWTGSGTQTLNSYWQNLPGGDPFGTWDCDRSDGQCSGQTAFQYPF